MRKHEMKNNIFITKRREDSNMNNNVELQRFLSEDAVGPYSEEKYLTVASEMSHKTVFGQFIYRHIEHFENAISIIHGCAIILLVALLLWGLMILLVKSFVASILFAIIIGALFIGWFLEYAIYPGTAFKRGLADYDGTSCDTSNAEWELRKKLRETGLDAHDVTVVSPEIYRGTKKIKTWLLFRLRDGEKGWYRI